MSPKNCVGILVSKVVLDKLFDRDKFLISEIQGNLKKRGICSIVFDWADLEMVGEELKIVDGYYFEKRFPLQDWTKKIS